MCILNDFPKLQYKEGHGFLYVVTFVFPWLYIFFYFTFVSGRPLKSVKSRFHCILNQPHWIIGKTKKYIHGSGTETSWRMKITIFWAVMPCSLVVHYQRFRGKCCLHLQGPTQNTEAVGSCEMLVIIYQIMQHHLQKDDSLHRHHCPENPKFCSWKMTWKTRDGRTIMGNDCKTGSGWNWLRMMSNGWLWN
jgi:hypothetical protein